MSSSSPSPPYGYNSNTNNNNNNNNDDCSNIITELQPADVLFGRGSGPNDHEGNVWFRQLVAERKPEYMATNHRMTKAKIAREIVDAVLNKNGRFLRKLEAADVQQKQQGMVPDGVDVWVCVDDDTIMEKAKQALRQNTSKTKTSTGGGGGGIGSPAGSGEDVKKAPHPHVMVPYPSSSSAASIPSSSNSINSHQSNRTMSTGTSLLGDAPHSNHHSHNNNNNNTINYNMARQIPSSLSDLYDDFEPLPITSSAVVSVTNMNSFNNSNSIYNMILNDSSAVLDPRMQHLQQQQQQRQADNEAALANSGRGGGGYYSVVSPESSLLEPTASAMSLQQQQEETQMAAAIALAAAGLSTGTTPSGYGGVVDSATAALEQNNQFLSQMASGPPPIVPWGSNSDGDGGGDDGDYTLQHEPVLSVPNVRQQQQQQQVHHYQHQSQQQQQQNRYAQHAHNQSVARIPQQSDNQQLQQPVEQEQQPPQQQEQRRSNPREGNARESLTLKDVFRSSDSGFRRGSMDMSELMDSFRAAKLGPGETETSKKLMASTDTMGTIEQYNTGSYAEMSMATVNSSTFSFMKGDESAAQLDSSHVYDYQHHHHQQQQHRNSLAPPSNLGSSLNSNMNFAGRSILVPGGGGGGGGVGGVGRPNLSSSATGSSNSTLHTTDSSSNYKFAQRDSVCSNKSTLSDTSISINDLAFPRRKSGATGIVSASSGGTGGGAKNLSGVREDAEGFGQEETQFSTAALDVDPLPMSEQQMSSATVEGLSNSSLSMLKGMILSTDDMGAFQDEQQQQQQQFSNRQQDT